MATALAAAQAEYNRVMTQRGITEADIAATEAKLSEQARQANMEYLLQQALLAEKARQADALLGFEAFFKGKELSLRERELMEKLRLADLELQYQRELQKRLLSPPPTGTSFPGSPWDIFLWDFESIPRDYRVGFGYSTP